MGRPRPADWMTLPYTRTSRLALISLALVMSAAGARARCEEAKLVASDGADADLFGRAIALAPGRALIGAWLDDGACPLDHDCNSGAAYVFDRTASGWVESAKLTGRAGERACAIFRRLGEAEAKVHGFSVDEVHFHEVGAVDSIVDIVGICAGMELLGIDEVCCSAIPVGSGTVETAHGRLPVPAPATAQLLRGVPVFDNGLDAEVTTPTAAAALTTLADSFGPMPEMTVQAIGYGAGSKEFDAMPNLLRVFLGEKTADGTADSLVELAANIDDSTGEVIGATIEKLLADGCVDAWAAPIVMKKSRPAWVLSALCRLDQVRDIERILFTETTTFGVRRRPCTRSKLSRHWQTVETPYGPIRMKIGRLETTETSASPEFEDCLQASQAHGVSAREVAAAAVEAYRRKDR